MNVAFLTCSAFPTLYKDDLLAVDALQVEQCDVAPVIWNQTSPAHLSTFDAVVVRSPWDWFHHRAEFRTFVESLSSVTCPVFNSPAVLRDFADKRYLRQLQQAGLPVVPTIVLDSLDEAPRLLAEQTWAEVVLKPAFTAAACDAHRFRREELGTVCASATNLGAGEQWLLQPFMPEVLTGELSFVFFGNTFSHAVHKKPKVDDWRVQELWGGEAKPFTPSPALVTQARTILNAAAPDTLYARVDGVVVDERLLLMELELVEPELFFRFESSAPTSFAKALLSRIG